MSVITWCTKTHVKLWIAGNLNKFSDHHSLVDSSAHGFERNFIGPFLLYIMDTN